MGEDAVGSDSAGDGIGDYIDRQDRGERAENPGQASATGRPAAATIATPKAADQAGGFVENVGGHRRVGRPRWAPKPWVTASVDSHADHTR